MAPIRIPRTPASAYDDSRPASDLLRAHVENLEKAVRGARTRTAVTPALTEAQAARYIRELGRQLHQMHLLPALAPAPTIGQRPATATSTKKPKAARRARTTRKGSSSARRKAGGTR